jgi:ankyrin repeat protein
MTRKVSRGVTAFVALSVSVLATSVSVQAGAAEVPPLIDAVKQGDAATVRTLIDQGVDVSATEVDGTTALHWAAHLGDATAAALLIDAGVDPKAITRNGATAYALACSKGHPEVIALFLEAGADPNAVITGEPAIMKVARAGNPAAVRVLLAAGGDPNVTEPDRGQTALMWAASAGNVEAVKVLLEFGADIDARSTVPDPPPGLGPGRIPRVNDPLGLRAHRDPDWSQNRSGMRFTPIMWAVREGHMDVVKVLLDDDFHVAADVNDEKPGVGTTNLILAIINRHYELAAYLLERGADPNAGPGYTALHQVAWSRRLNKKFGPRNPEATGTMGGLELAKLLIEHDVDINARMTRSFEDGYRNRMIRIGATAFLLSSKLVDLPMMKLLVESGADIHIKNVDAEGANDSALMLAAGVAILNPGGEDAGSEEEVLEAVQYLLDLGFDPNERNNNGEASLHGAAYRGYNKVAQLLLNHGAELGVENILGWKPVTVADGLFFAGFFKSQPQMAAFLREAYAERGLTPPDPPAVNDTSLLTVAARFKVGDVVKGIEGSTSGRDFAAVDDPDAAAADEALFQVTEVDAQGQIMATAPYTGE